MSQRSRTAVPGPDSRLPLALRAWLGAGLLALAVLPAARGHSQWIGWLPFWLVAAPLLMLAVAEHARVGAALQALVARRRRLRARRPQARALRPRHHPRRAA